MNKEQITYLCQVFSLGDVMTQPEALSGNFFHSIWRLTTSKGVFALKKINTSIFYDIDAFKHCLLCEQIVTICAAQHLPVLPAIKGKNGPVEEMDHAPVLVFPWIEGRILPPTPAPSAQARLIGSLLARIHAIPFSLPDLQQPEQLQFSTEEWAILAQQVAEMQLPFSTMFHRLLPHINHWCEQYKQAAETLNQRLVVSHADLDQKNVIWKNASSPIVIDWESAGLINPTLEVVSAALSWSGQLVGEMQPEAFTALLDAYIHSGGKLYNAGEQTLCVLIGHRLRWLRNNLRSIVKDGGEATLSKTIHTSIIINTLNNLQILERQAALWAAWIDQRR